MNEHPLHNLGVSVGCHLAHTVDDDVVGPESQPQNGEHLLGDRRREAERLSSGRERADDLLDVTLESAVEQHVALIQDEHLDTGEPRGEA